MNTPLLALGLLLGASAATVPHPAPVYCHISVLRDYELGFAYYARLLLDPDCPAQGQARVRKTSTVSTRRNGAPYQPINPNTGAWTITQNGGNVPPGATFTFNSWVWQEWTGDHWQTVAAR